MKSPRAMYPLFALLILFGTAGPACVVPAFDDGGITSWNGEHHGPASASYPVTGTVCDGDNHRNDDHLDGVSMGPVLLAHNWFPDSAALISAIEIYTGEVAGSSAVGIWSSNGTTPDAPLGWSASFNVDLPKDWYGADLNNPVAVSAGTEYWIVFEAIDNSQSPVDDDPAGEQQTYYGIAGGTVSSVPNWNNGPYSFPDRRWKTKVYCDGSDLDGDGRPDGTDSDMCFGEDTSGDSDLDGFCDDIDPCFGDNDSGDADGDGWCAEEAGNVLDCDDEDDTVHPGAVELCDGIDNACDGDLAQETDLDGDGFSECAGDCDETDPAVHPAAPELCDGIDNDCDDTLAPDEEDMDGDGRPGCDDCDDSNAQVHPGAQEACDGVDTDCDGDLPDDESDADADGVSICDGDCNDDDPAVTEPDEAGNCLPDMGGAPAQGCGCRSGRMRAGPTGLLLLVPLLLRRRSARTEP